MCSSFFNLAENSLLSYPLTQRHLSSSPRLNFVNAVSSGHVNANPKYGLFPIEGLLDALHLIKGNFVK